MMLRRQFLAGAGALLVGPAAMAIGPGKSEQRPNDPSSVGRADKPYVDIGDFADDRGRVFLFFSYGCQFCAQYAPAIVEWSKTFPPSLRLVRVPVITTDKTTQAAALAYYIVRDLAPQRLDEFDLLAYGASATVATPETYPAIMRQMKFSRAAIEASMNRQDTKDRLVRSVILSKRYKVTATPHFGVGGRYATNVNFTNGNYSMLMELMSGLVSQVLAS